jgi:hypothetical protein
MHHPRVSCQRRGSEIVGHSPACRPAILGEAVGILVGGSLQDCARGGFGRASQLHRPVARRPWQRRHGGLANTRSRPDEWLSPRRLAKDWGNLNRNALAFLKLASIRLMLRKLCNP